MWPLSSTLAVVECPIAEFDLEVHDRAPLSPVPRSGFHASRVDDRARGEIDDTDRGEVSSHRPYIREYLG
jgi:hypothetical protein